MSTPYEPILRHEPAHEGAILCAECRTGILNRSCGRDSDHCGCACIPPIPTERFIRTIKQERPPKMPELGIIPHFEPVEPTYAPLTPVEETLVGHNLLRWAWIPLGIAMATAAFAIDNVAARLLIILSSLFTLVIIEREK